MIVLELIFLFIIASVIGYRIISNIPSMLHTPLMSGTNALSGVTILGALVVTATAVKLNNQVLGMFAVVLATINVVGGFKVTHRMLKMFKENNSKKKL